eukprot:82149_1
MSRHPAVFGRDSSSQSRRTKRNSCTFPRYKEPHKPTQNPALSASAIFGVSHTRTGVRRAMSDGKPTVPKSATTDGTLSKTTVETSFDTVEPADYRRTTKRNASQDRPLVMNRPDPLSLPARFSPDPLRTPILDETFSNKVKRELSYSQIHAHPRVKAPPRSTGAPRRFHSAPNTPRTPDILPDFVVDDIFRRNFREKTQRPAAEEKGGEQTLSPDLITSARERYLRFPPATHSHSTFNNRRHSYPGSASSTPIPASPSSPKSPQQQLTLLKRRRRSIRSANASFRSGSGSPLTIPFGGPEPTMSTETKRASVIRQASGNYKIAPKKATTGTLNGLSHATDSVDHALDHIRNVSDTAHRASG